jgi:hypothetical protein
MLKAGLYDDLITQKLRDEISRLQGEGVVSLLGGLTLYHFLEISFFFLRKILLTINSKTVQLNS